jgi:hypothetical protein
MPLGSHPSLRSSEKDLSALDVFLAIPGKAGTAVKSPQMAQESRDIRSFNHYVVVVGKDTPGDCDCFLFAEETK